MGSSVEPGFGRAELPWLYLPWIMPGMTCEVRGWFSGLEHRGSSSKATRKAFKLT